MPAPTLMHQTAAGAHGGSVIILGVPPSRTPAPSTPDARPAAFDVAAAYDAHASELFGFAVNALRDRSAAEDCVQETFLRAWRSRDQHDPGRSSVRTWLFAIVRNLVRDRFRTLARSPHVVAIEEGSDVPSRDRDPIERLAILEALATLSREHREAVVAIHLVGLSYAELAETLGVPIATLRTRTLYGLRALRAHIEEGEVADVRRP